MSPAPLLSNGRYLFTPGPAGVFIMWIWFMINLTAQHTIFSLILFLHNHQTNSHSLSTLSCFCFKISSLSVNTEMLFHLCLNQTSNGGDILQSITVCVFWSRVIPGLKGWWWRARYSVTPLCWSEYQVSTCQQPAYWTGKVLFYWHFYFGSVKTSSQDQEPKH